MEELLGALVKWIKYGAIGVMVIAGIFVMKQWHSMEQPSRGDTPQTTVGSVRGAGVTRAADDCGCKVGETPAPRPVERPTVVVVVEAPPPVEQSEVQPHHHYRRTARRASIAGYHAARQPNDSPAQDPVFSVNTPPVIGNTMQPGPQMFAAVADDQQVVFGYDITVHPKKHRWPRRFFGAIGHGIRKVVTLGH